MDRITKTLIWIVVIQLLHSMPALSQNTGIADYVLDSSKVTASYSVNNRGNNFLYTPGQALNTISVIGEPDVIRHISSLPGVSQGMDGTLGLFVRCANNGSNRVELNGVPLDCASHLIGMFSVFSPDVIATSTFSPGGLSAEYGDVSSSLIDIKTRRASKSPLRKSVSISPYLTSVYGLFPSRGGKSGVQASFRFSPAIIAGSLAMKANAEKNASGMNGNIFDACVISDWNYGKANTFDVMLFATQDYFSFFYENNGSTLRWGDVAAKFGWRSELSETVDLYSKIYYVFTDSYQEQAFYRNSDRTSKTSDISIRGAKSNLTVQSSASWLCSKNLTVNAGLMGSRQTFRPVVRKLLSSADVDSETARSYSMNLLALYAETSLDLRKLEASFGIRNTVACSDGQPHYNFDVRAKTDYSFSGKTGIELTFDKLTQYHHVIEGLPTGWSLDVCVPASGDFPEEVTVQGYAGIFKDVSFKHSDLHFTSGVYYRTMKNLLSYLNPVNSYIEANSDWQNEVDAGTGKSFGAELAAVYSSDKISGTLAYTLSKTTRKFPKINDGLEFPFKFDRRHILNLQGKYMFSSAATKRGKTRMRYLNGVLSYSSGNRVTAYVSSYQGISLPYWNQRSKTVNYPDEFEELNYNRHEMTGRNALKMKDYFRIDLAYAIETTNNGRTSSWSFSIFNILNRHNAYMVFNENGKWKQLSIMPIMPSVRWSLEF
jgi:hypothetical protein